MRLSRWENEKKPISHEADGICLTFQWEDYWNSDEMKLEDIRFHYFPTPTENPYRMSPGYSVLWLVQQSSIKAANWISLSGSEPPFSPLNRDTGRLVKRHICIHPQMQRYTTDTQIDLFTVLCCSTDNCVFIKRNIITRPHTVLYYRQSYLSHMLLSNVSHDKSSPGMC